MGVCLSLEFTLITAAHHFMIAALPPRDPETPEALARFTRAVYQGTYPSFLVDAVLLRILSVAQRHAGVTVPTLLERYLALESTTVDHVKRFEQCFREVLTHRQIRHPKVRQAVAIIS